MRNAKPAPKIVKLVHLKLRQLINSAEEIGNPSCSLPSLFFPSFFLKGLTYIVFLQHENGLAASRHMRNGIKLIDQCSTETFERIYCCFKLLPLFLLLLLFIDRWIDDRHVVLLQVSLPQPLLLPRPWPLKKSLKIGIVPGLFSEAALEAESQ